MTAGPGAEDPEVSAALHLVLLDLLPLHSSRPAAVETALMSAAFCLMVERLGTLATCDAVGGAVLAVRRGPLVPPPAERG